MGKEVENQSNVGFPSARAGIALALIFLIWKMGLFFTGYQHSIAFLENFPIAPNLFLLFCGMIWVTLRYVKTSSQYDAFAVIREAGKLGLVNAVFSAGFVFLYYKFIDVEFLAIRKEKSLTEAAKVLNKEQLIQYSEQADFFNSLSVMSLGTLSGLTIVGLIGAVIVALIGQLVLKRRV